MPVAQSPQRLTFSSMTPDEHVLNRFWRLWLPIGLALAVFAMQKFDRDLAWELLFVEGTGLFEILHILLPLFVVAIALRMSFRFPANTDVRLKVWVWLLGAGCFYIAGEEASWGQHIFGWGTPEAWSELNRQQETNLHNTTSWLNHKPRAILNVGVFVGSVLIPVLGALGVGSVKIARFSFILPGRSCHVTGWFVVFYNLWDDLAKAGHVPDIAARHSEMHENYLYGYLAIYALTLSARFTNWTATTEN